IERDEWRVCESQVIEDDCAVQPNAESGKNGDFYCLDRHPAPQDSFSFSYQLGFQALRVYEERDRGQSCDKHKHNDTSNDDQFFRFHVGSPDAANKTQVDDQLLTFTTSRFAAFLEKSFGRHRGWNLLRGLVFGEDQECGVAPPLELFEQRCFSFSMLRIHADVENRLQILLDLGPAENSPFQLCTVFAPIGIEVERHRLTCLLMFTQGFRVTGSILV